MIPGITEVNFPSYATLHKATVSLQDMGDRVISTQVKIDGGIVPSFEGWELKFRGERFVLPSNYPQASKDNSTRCSLIDMQFQSWVVQELKRYFFFEATSVSTGTAIADKYVSPVRMNVENFVANINKVLAYYFNGKIVADLYLSGTGIYSEETKVVDINYSYLWDVIGQVFEVFGVRNRIEYDAATDVYTIKFGYPDVSIDDHDFEYGYKGGLLKFERHVEDETIHNILLGRGGEQNLPYRYFKRADSQNPGWAADPDAIPELANIYFDRLRDANFRRYVQGWRTNPNRDTSWEAVQEYDATRGATDWAYKKGHEDEVFSPVEYVKDDESIAAYGERWGSLDDNDDIYPSIQGRSREPIGRIDEVVAVSPIITDDIDAMAASAALEKSINPLLVTYPGKLVPIPPIQSEMFEIPAGQGGYITYAWVGKVDDNALVSINSTESSLVAVDESGKERPIAGMPAGRYRLRLTLVLNTPEGQTVTGTFGIENIKLHTAAKDENAWKPTFDIWVKDIWGSTRESGESDYDYSLRVWGPILGDRAGKEAKVVFSTGFMSISEDYEFVIASYPVPDTSKALNGVSSAWRITLRKSDAEYDATGLYIPNADTNGKPVAGDKFFFTGIDMPHLYVTLAEEDLNTSKSEQVKDLSAVTPTWVISLDKVRVHTLEDGEFGSRLADRLSPGVKLRITDPRFTGGDVLKLYAQTVTYTWDAPSDGNPYLVPDIEVVLSDRVESRESRVDKIESSVDQIKLQYAKVTDIESIIRKVADPLFLKKTGESDSSDSPTQFASKVSSKGFRQGAVGGKGWGFYLDNTDETAKGEAGEGDSVIEVDRIVARKGLEVNSLVVNQVEYQGGLEIISAAEIKITKVVETDASYICYFDQRQDSVANNFVAGDIAYGQVFSPRNASLRYYKCKVDSVGIDRIELSKTVKAGDGAPQAGDVLVQYGNVSDASRQYVIVRDVIRGGYERMIHGLDSVSTDGVEYFFAGKQAGENPRWFVGDKDAEYAEWKDGELNIKGRFSVRKDDGTYQSISQFMKDNDSEYLRAATNYGTTILDGGLVLTNIIALGQTVDNNFQINAGINGIMNAGRNRLGGGVAAWYGGEPSDKDDLDTGVTEFAKAIFRFDGSGYLANGGIHWDKDGYGGIPGISWNTEDGKDVVTIGGNVKLESTTGDSVTELLVSVRKLLGMFIDEEYEVDGNKRHRIRVNSDRYAGLYTTGFLSVRGLDDTTGSGSGGTDLPAVWESLTKNEMPYQDVTINTAHIPTLPQSKVTGLPDALSSLRLGYTGISALIPQAATADNQLADKEFVNSSIATATATFRGTFATLEALKATPADRNDYAFWAHKDEAGNTCYDKYTYDGSSWKFEYRLNNSSFTAAQWGAINSGITDTLVTKLSGIATGAQVNVIETVKLGGTALAVSGKAVDITGTGIKSALGISDWALAASKPSYTTAEVTEKTNLYYTNARVKAYADTLYLGKSATAAAATKLANSRKLWGNAFNGTADVNGDITLGSGKRIYFGSTSYYIELVNGNIHTNVGLYSDKFISARSADPDAGGGSGASLPVVWASLQGNTDDYKDETIHQAHIPTLPVSRIDGLATALAGKQPLITDNSKLDYSLLKNTPTIGNGTVTIKQNGNSKGSFTMNQSGGATINLTDTTYSSLAAASGGAAVSLVTTGEKYTWNNKQAAISDLATIRSNAANGATAHGWGDHSKAGYITGITKAMVESVLTGNITSHTHTFDSLTSKPTTLGGYGIEDWIVKTSTASPDTLKTAGNYKVAIAGTSGNGYNFNYGQVLVLCATTDSNTIAQIAAPYDNNNLYFRSGTVSNFTDANHPWRTIYTSGNCNKSDVDWNAANLTAEKRVRIKNANVIAFLSTDAMSKERLLGPMSSYNYDLAWHNGAQWNKVYHSGNFIDGTDYISPKTTLVGYGITDASRIFRYTIPASGNKGVRITFTANEPVKITVSGSNQHAQLVLVGTGYGEGGFIRNNFTELVHSDSGYSWCMPDEACSVEVFSTRTVSDYVTVESPSPVTFTAISALSKTAVGRRLLNSSNYSSFALPLTGGTMSGSIRMDGITETPLLIRNYSRSDGSAGGWTRSVVECRVDDKNAFRIMPFGSYTPGAANNKIAYTCLGFANYDGLNLRIFENDIKWGNSAIFHEGNSNLPTVPWKCSSLTANGSVEAKANLYGQSLKFLNIASSAGHGGFIDFHFNGYTGDYTSRIIEDAKGRLSLRTPIVRVGTTSSATLTLARPSFNYIWTDVAGGTLVLGTTDGGITSSSNSAIFIKGKKVYIGGTETGNNALNVLGVAHATTGIYTDGYISARKQDTSSDIRLKTDFRPIAGALEYIRGTHFTRFRWKDGSGESVGIIAQEEQSREYGFLVRSHGEIGHLTYDYAASTALLGAALQEEDDKVEALKRRVKELENKLDRLKQSNYAN